MSIHSDYDFNCKCSECQEQLRHEIWKAILWATIMAILVWGILPLDLT